MSSYEPPIDDGRVRASSQTTQTNVSFDGPQATVVTAEIPAVRAGRSYATSSARAGQRANMRPPSWQPEPLAEPAPPGVRLLVWALLFVFIILLVAFLAGIAHPTWLSFLRNTSSTATSPGPLHQISTLVTKS